MASADGLRFVVPVRTIHPGPHPRYFGQERGVTCYNLTSDLPRSSAPSGFTGLGGIVVPGTLRNSLTLLPVLLEQETALQPTEVMTDTGAMFGIFHLLGFQFSPRLADVGGARFWRVDPKADYGALDGLARHRARMPLVVQNWDDLLRLAGPPKLGLVLAGGLIRTLQTKDCPTRLARALEEWGRMVRSSTYCTASTMRHEAYRRRILVQLNRGESRHQLARAVFHGKRGELPRRPEGPARRLGPGGQRHRALEHVVYGCRPGPAPRRGLRQVGGFAACASRHGHAFADCALRLPRAWADDAAHGGACAVRGCPRSQAAHGGAGSGAPLRRACRPRQSPRNQLLRRRTACGDGCGRQRPRRERGRDGVGRAGKDHALGAGARSPPNARGPSRWSPERLGTARKASTPRPGGACPQLRAPQPRAPRARGCMAGPSWGWPASTRTSPPRRCPAPGRAARRSGAGPMASVHAPPRDAWLAPARRSGHAGARHDGRHPPPRESDGSSTNAATPVPAATPAQATPAYNAGPSRTFAASPPAWPSTASSLPTSSRGHSGEKHTGPAHNTAMQSANRNHSARARSAAI